MAVTEVGTPNAPVSITSSGATLTGTWSGTQPRTAGDLLVAVVSAGGSGVSAALPTPAGWTKVGEGANSTYCRVAVYWTVATGGDGGWSAAVTTGTGEASVMQFELAGANTTTPIQTSGTGTATTGTCTATSGAAVAHSGSYALAGFASYNSTAASSTFTAGGTGFASEGSYSASSRGHSGFSSNPSPATGSTVAPTGAFSATTSYKSGMVAVIQPTPPAPPGNFNRLWPSTNGSSVAADTSTADLGVEFYVTSATPFYGYYWWCPSSADTNAAHFTFKLYSTSNGTSGTLITGSTATPWSTLTAGAWNYIPLDSPVTLTANTRYRAVIANTAGGSNWYGSTSNYWAAGGGGANGITRDLLVAPNAANALNGSQGSFNEPGTGGFPTSDYQHTNYWVDVCTGVTSFTGSGGAACGKPGTGGSGSYDITGAGGIGGSGGSGIAEDSSTPATVTANGTAPTAVTAQFSPPANSLLVAVVSVGYAGTGGVPSITVSDSGSHGWTPGPNVWDTQYDGAYVFTCQLTSAPGNITVSAKNNDSTHGASGIQLSLRVVTGAASSQSGAATQTAYSATSSTAVNSSITTTQAGSWVYMAAEVSGAVTLTPLGNTSTIATFNDSVDTETGICGRQTNATVTPGATTLGWTASSGRPWAWAALEVLPATGGKKTCAAGTGTYSTAGSSGSGGAARIKPAASATGTLVPYAGTGGAVCKRPAAAASGTLAVTGSGGITRPKLAISGTAAEAFAAGGNGFAKRPAATGAGSYTPPGFLGTGGITSKKLGFSGTGAETFGGAGGPAAKRPTATGTAAEAFAGTGSAARRKPTASATGAYGGVAGSGNLARGRPSAAGTGSEQFAGTGSAARRKPTASATGVEQFAGTGSAPAKRPTATGTGTASGQNITGTGGIPAKKITASGVGGFGALFGTGSARAGKPTVNASGSEVFSGSATAWVKHPQSSGTATETFAGTGSLALKKSRPFGLSRGYGLISVGGAELNSAVGCGVSAGSEVGEGGAVRTETSTGTAPGSAVCGRVL